MSNWLIVNRELITVYSENNTKPIISLCGNGKFINVKESGTYELQILKSLHTLK
jgi:hypothetical protein